MWRCLEMRSKAAAQKRALGRTGASPAVLSGRQMSQGLCRGRGGQAGRPLCSDAMPGCSGSPCQHAASCSPAPGACRLLLWQWHLAGCRVPSAALTLGSANRRKRSVPKHQPGCRELREPGRAMAALSLPCALLLLLLPASVLS